jgi:hypothetical protein
VRDHGEFWVNAYMGVMPNKPIEIPAAAAKAFVRDMRAYFAAGSSTIKADAIAARQLQP